VTSHGYQTDREAIEACNSAVHLIHAFQSFLEMEIAAQMQNGAAAIPGAAPF
jgi:hypothetical protein